MGDTSRDLKGTFETNIDAATVHKFYDWSQVWKYRDMIFLMIRRDFLANYKQTILGPVWAILQPVASTLVTALVFGKLSGLSPAGIPSYLFYMGAGMVWDFFAQSLTSTANTFIRNSSLMGKVYYPRLASSVASIGSAFVTFLIHLGLFVGFYIWYVATGAGIRPHITILLAPIYLIHLAILALGSGSILSAMTTKYRDLVILINFGVTVWYYLSPVVYGLEKIPAKYHAIYLLNPTAPLLLHLKYAVFGVGELMWGYYFLSLAVSIVLLVIGGRIFSRVERNFIDTI